MSRGEKTKLLWQDPIYRAMMKKRHKESKRCQELMANSPRHVVGRKESEAVKAKMSKSMTGILKPVGFAEKISKLKMGNTYMLGKKHSAATKRQMSESRIALDIVGEKTTGWQGGISALPYAPKFTRTFRRKIRRLFGEICIVCKHAAIELGESTCLHHIDYDKQNCELSNLCLLCRCCHAATNHNREYWRKKLSALKKVENVLRLECNRPMIDSMHINTNLGDSSNDWTRVSLDAPRGCKVAV